MYTVAILADIHGNVPALEAVLDDVARQRPDEVLVGGDLVGRGPEGRRVVRAIAETGWPTIRGNHEEYLLDFRRGRVPAEWRRREEWAASRWMAEELDRETEAWVAELPFAARPAGAPGLLLIHGSPRSVNEGLGPWSSDRRLERHLAAIDESLLVCGHTHRPMRRKLPSGEVVNVGSVGLPFNRDRRAQYALFHYDGESWQCEPQRVEYDVEATLAAYRTTGFEAAGGVTARLLALELRHAAPFLVPFQTWAAALGRRPRAAHLQEFLDLYDPDQPLHDWLLRLKELSQPGRAR